MHPRSCLLAKLKFSYSICSSVVNCPRTPIDLKKVPELPVVDFTLYSKNILGMRIKITVSMIVILKAAIISCGGTSWSK